MSHESVENAHKEPFAIVRDEETCVAGLQRAQHHAEYNATERVTRRTSPHRLHRSSVSVSSTLVYILCCILITCSVSAPHYLRSEPVHSPGAGLDGAPSSGLQDLHVLRLRSPAPPSMLPKPWYVSFIARLMKPATDDFHVSAFFRFLMSSVRNRVRHEAGNARFQSTGVTNPPLPSSQFSPRAQASHAVRCTVCTKIISGVLRNACTLHAPSTTSVPTARRCPMSFILTCIRCSR
jgi:hypothetical protein